MKTTTITKHRTLVALGTLAAAGLALGGCSTPGANQTETASIEGAYVLAPDDGEGLFTMTVTGRDVQVSHQTCSAGDGGETGPGVDPRETAFGQLAEKKEDDSQVSITWFEGGAFTDESKAQLRLLSDGRIARVGKRTFFAADGTQGEALRQQFTDECASGSSPTPQGPGETDATEPAQEADQGEQDGTPAEGNSAGPIVDLTPQGGSTSYVHAYDSGGLLSPSEVIGPWMLQWVVDGDQVTYREVLCTGTAAKTATGTLEVSGEEHVVRWDAGDDPWTGNAPTETTSAEVTETTMRVGLPEDATTDVASQKETFAGYCAEAGKDIADIFTS